MSYDLAVLKKAYPEAATVCSKYGAIDREGNIIELDQARLDAAAEQVQAERDATAYISQRAREYPSMADLADAMYWNSTGDSTKLDEYYAACAAVKAKYPKPEAD